MNRYVALVERRHDGFASLSESERASLATEINAVRVEIDDWRTALDAHTSEHGRTTLAAEPASSGNRYSLGTR